MLEIAYSQITLLSVIFLMKLHLKGKQKMIQFRGNYTRKEIEVSKATLPPTYTLLSHTYCLHTLCSHTHCSHCTHILYPHTLCSHTVLTHTHCFHTHTHTVFSLSHTPIHTRCSHKVHSLLGSCRDFSFKEVPSQPLFCFVL